MEPGRPQGNYLRYIGAGAVAAGGIISMLPGPAADLRLDRRRPARPARQPRGRRRHGRAAPSATCRCPSSSSAASALVLVLACGPALGLGLEPPGPARRGHDPAVRLPVRHGVVAADRRGRLVVEPDLRHDHRHAAADLPDLPRCSAGPDMPAHADGADGRGGGVHRLVQRRHHSQDLKTGFLVGATPKQAAVGHPDRGAHLGRGHRRAPCWP